MKTENRPLHICFASDENYRRGLWVSVGTLLAANRNHSLVLHILDGGLRSRSIQKLLHIVYETHSDVDVEFHSMNEEVFSNAPLGPGNSRMTYARLLCGSLFRDLDVILYVDVDMLINADLGSFELCLANNSIIAGVPCPIVGVLENDCAWSLKESERRAPYLNAGILAVNLNAWREAGIEDAAMDRIKQDPESCRFWDQTLINYLCRGRIGSLPLRLNLLPEDWNLAAQEDGGVIHYLAPEKPWAVWRPEPAFQLWREAWRRHVAPISALLLSPAMAASALRFFWLSIARRSRAFSRLLGAVTKFRSQITRNPVKRRILDRYRDSALCAPDSPREPVDVNAFFNTCRRSSA